MQSFKGGLKILLLGFLFLSCNQSPAEKKPLYYVNPMDPTVKSETPMKDGMGMDYVPVYDESPGGAEITATGGDLLYYANPMDPTVHSPVPLKDEMGMDYVPVYAQVSKDLFLKEDQEEKIGVAVTTVEKQILSPEIRTVGKIGYNEQKTRVVSARVPGRIEKLYVSFTGLTVASGQPLLTLYSPTLVSAQQELLQAVAQKNSTGTLATVGNGLFESSKARLRLWGLSLGQIDTIISQGKPDPNLVLLSPLTGTVVKLGVTSGQYVEEGMVLFELSDLSRVWVEAEIFEKDFSQVTPESRIRVIPLAYPDQVFEDKISFINPVLDPNTRSVRIRSEVPNPQGLLLPGMFVSVVVLTPTTEAVLVVPESAVLDTGLRKLVYVKKGPGQYSPREVILKTRVGTVYPVVTGLEEGEQVVTAANFLMDSESRLKGLVD